MASLKKTAPGVVALLNASDDTIEMVQKMIVESKSAQSLIQCHFTDLKKGKVNFDKFMETHNPAVVIFDISPPYYENWKFFKKMRDAKTMDGRGLVLTTTNKLRLDEMLGEDSQALEVVGKPDDLAAIREALKRETAKAEITRGL